MLRSAKIRALNYLDDASARGAEGDADPTNIERALPGTSGIAIRRRKGRGGAWPPALPILLPVLVLYYVYTNVFDMKSILASDRRKERYRQESVKSMLARDRQQARLATQPVVDHPPSSGDESPAPEERKDSRSDEGRGIEENGDELLRSKRFKLPDESDRRTAQSEEGRKKEKSKSSGRARQLETERSRSQAGRAKSRSAAGDGGREGIRKTLGNYTEDMTDDDMWDDLDCDKIFKEERPVHSQTTWLNARGLYRSIVGNESTIGTSGQDDVDVPNGFSVAVEAKQAPPKGRGVFALEDISKGALVYTTKKTARFRTGPAYRKFIYGLEEGLACDVLQWAYVQDVGGGELRVSVDLDEACFCNNSGRKANVGCHKKAAKSHKGGCVENDFATRDIDAGEELLCSYSEFAVKGGWKKFGL